jgi:putative phage-type endonuclease
MNIIDAVQGSPEWLAARIGRVTASRMADVMAQGRGATRAAYMGELAAEILTGVSAESYTNADMQRGTELEPIARAAYETETRQMVDSVGLVLHPRNDRWAASPDGIVGDDGLLELKCPKTHTHIAYLLAGKPPAQYLPQMAWQAACCGRAWVDFASYDPRMPEPLQLFIVRYSPPAAYIAELEAAADAFLLELDAMVSALRTRRAEIERLDRRGA